MKNAVLIYKPNHDGIFNIGDYIQSLAAAQFFGKDAYVYLNREELSEYRGERAVLFMNGWFMHYPENWPPSNDITPKFLAFHMNSMVYDYLLSEKSIAYLKRCEPVGCRDYKTMELLRQRGVDAYFSGCMTLTLGLSYKSATRGDSIYFTDPYCYFSKCPMALAKSLWSGFISKRSMVKILAEKIFGNTTLRSRILAGQFYNQYCKLFDDAVFEKAVFIKQEISDERFNNEDEKFAYAKHLLSLYSQAKYVVTSRIHCALPCLGLETPVLYVENMNQLENSYCRLDGLRELFTIIRNNKGIVSCDDIDSKLNCGSTFENKSSDKELRDKLIVEAEKFIKNTH